MASDSQAESTLVPVDMGGAQLIFDWINETEDIKRLQRIASGDLNDFMPDDQDGDVFPPSPSANETSKNLATNHAGATVQTQLATSTPIVPNPSLPTPQIQSKDVEIPSRSVFYPNLSQQQQYYPPQLTSHALVNVSNYVPSTNSTATNQPAFASMTPTAQQMPYFHNSQMLPVVYMMPQPFYVVQPVPAQVASHAQTSLAQNQPEIVSLKTPTANYVYAGDAR